LGNTLPRTIEVESGTLLLYRHIEDNYYNKVS